MTHSDSEGQAALNRIAALARQRAATDCVVEEQTFMHPNSGLKIAGVRLEAGAVLKATDLYPNRDGVWRPAGAKAGTKIESNDSTAWIRPTAPTPP